jgi:hypothetical protein
MFQWMDMRNVKVASFSKQPKYKLRKENIPDV